VQKKTTPFQKWYEKRIQECRHIPTFTGKKARNNLFVIYALACKGDASCWDLALEYVRQTEPNFNNLTPDTVYRKRLVANATLNRSLLTLQLKGYVSKEGTLYKLTKKGDFLVIMLDPSLLMEKVLEEAFDELTSELVRAFFTSLFHYWKVNLDEISEDDLKQLVEKTLVSSTSSEKTHD
jgi:hypothetical protein